MKRTAALIPVALLSGSLLAYEVSLLRVFSIALWYHFAYLILSIAMLGFGASGTILALVGPRPGAADRYFAPLSLATALAEVVGLAAALEVPIEPFLIAWDPTESVSLIGFYVLLGVPFALGGAALALALLTWGRVREVYFADLAGAGAGALGVTALLYYLAPVHAVGVVAGASSLASSLAPRRPRGLTLLGLVGAVALPLGGGRILAQKTSPYKGLSTLLLTPGAKLEARAVSPLSVLEAVASPAVRYAPGLSLEYTGDLPEQIALFADGDQLGVVTRPDGALDFLDSMTAALPYRLLHPDYSALILGAGGGMEVLSALEHGARRVVAVEMDPRVVQVVRGTFAGAATGPYTDPRVEVRVSEARRFVESSSERFDLISICLLDSLAASASGVHAASESYLYTVEAVTACRERLEPGGILAITRWLKTPPRDVPRVFNTLVEALERGGDTSPGLHLAGIRSWSTATLLLKNAPLTEEDVARIRAFCQERSFDTFWHPGIAEAEANRFHVLPRPYYFEAARAVLSSERDSFVAAYPFQIEPTVDDRPYFFHFFRWRALPSLVGELGLEWIPFVEWGYLIVVAVVIQALVTSSGLLVLPLALAPRLRARFSVSRLRVAAYFGCLGMGYMFIEIALIQKFTLFLSHPVLSATTVITAMLVFSGLGSLLAGTVGLMRVTLGIAALSLAHVTLLPSIFEIFFRSPDLGRTALSVALIAPLGFLMGAPFPRGLARVQDEAPPLAPWAWAVNGFASVLGPPAATLLAMSLGFRSVLLSAAAMYLLAGALMRQQDL